MPGSGIVAASGEDDMPGGKASGWSSDSGQGTA